MLSAGFAYPFPAVDTSSVRTTERLAAFQSKVIESKPVDIYFTKYPLMEFLWSKKKMETFGSQMIFPVGTGGDPNGKFCSDYDEISMQGTNMANMVAYTPFEYSSSSTLSFTEYEEVGNSDLRLFDRLSFKRDAVENTFIKTVQSKLFSATQAAQEPTALPVAVLGSGALGGLTHANWVSVATAHSANWTNGGPKALSALINDIRIQKGDPKVLICTDTQHEVMEDEYLADVRYASSDMSSGLDRGSDKLRFKKIPLIWDPDCTSGVIYALDTDYMFFVVHPDANQKWFPMERIQDQFAYVAPYRVKAQLICTKRDAQGKLTAVTAA